MDICNWLLNDSANDIDIFASAPQNAEYNLLKYSTDEKNIFGALLSRVGGLCINATIRILGSTDNDELRDIYQWNITYGSSSFIIIGDDIFGGIFAINLRLEGLRKGNICYYAPDTLKWEDLNTSLTGYLNFLKKGNIKKFYENIPWDICTNIKINFNDVISFYPPQWSKEIKYTKINHKVIPVDEYYKMNFGFNKIE